MSDRLGEIRARLAAATPFIAHAPTDIACLLDEVAWSQEQLALAGAAIAATERYLDLCSDLACEYDGKSDACPSAAESGGLCEWCVMRRAVTAYRASAAPAESERGEGKP